MFCFRNTICQRKEQSIAVTSDRKTAEDCPTIPSPSSTTDQQLPIPEGSPTFKAAILPMSHHNSASKSEPWLLDRTYSVIVPSSAVSKGSRFIRVDFGLGDDNCSLDCWPFMTVEDLSHRPIPMPVEEPRKPPPAPTPPTTKVVEVAEPVFKMPTPVQQLRKSDHMLTPSIADLDTGRGSLLRALLESSDGAPHVEPMKECRPSLLRPRRQTRKILIKAKT